MHYLVKTISRKRLPVSRGPDPSSGVQKNKRLPASPRTDFMNMCDHHSCTYEHLITLVWTICGIAEK